jgi:hypothetical protein
MPSSSRCQLSHTQLDPTANSSVRLLLPFPAGALITAVSVRDFDRSQNGGLAVVLHEVNFPVGGPGTEAIGSDTFTSSDSLGSVDPLTLHPQTPISARHGEYLLASAGTHTNELDFCGAVVTYTLT